ETQAFAFIIFQLNPSTKINFTFLYRAVWHFFCHVKQLSKVTNSAVNFTQLTFIVLIISVFRAIAKTGCPRYYLSDFWAQGAVQILQLVFKFFIAFSG